MSFVCKYCQKSFTKESTLSVHVCESKRRWQQEKEVGVQLGFNSYLKFYEMTQGSAKTKGYADFASSPFYGAFVKYGRHLIGIRAINSSNFTEWLLKNNKKLDNWTSDKLYAEWLPTYLKKEAVQDALERSLNEMQDYADNNQDTINNFTDYFTHANANRICYAISSGRISSWITFNCSSGISFLDRLNEEQIGLIMPFIDPDYWQQKFRDYIADTEWVKDILRKAGL